MRTDQIISGTVQHNSIILLPVVNQEKIHSIICRLDSAFLHSVTNQPGFHELADKIAKRAVVMAAYADDVAVGYCACYMNDFINNTAYITLIAVKKEYQNRGIGTEILQYVKQAAAVNGFCKIRLEVQRENVSGIRFYEKNHFVLEGPASEHSNYMVCML